MTRAAASTQYILLPKFGYSGHFALAGPPITPVTEGFRLEAAGPPPAGPMERGDRIGGTGAMLVRLSPDEARELRGAGSAVKVCPLRRYTLARAQSPQVRKAVARTLTAGASTASVTIVDEVTGHPVEAAQVLVLSGFGQPVESRVTGPSGRVTLPVLAPDPQGRMPGLSIYPAHTHWGLHAATFPLSNGMKIQLARIDLAAPTVLSPFVAPDNSQRGDGVKVGVIDSGIDPNHPDLAVSGGANFTPAETNPDDWQAGADGHGTHVAGIIGGRGLIGQGMRGVAPGVELFSYRVFPKDKGGTSTYAIARAIDRAVEDGCDLINLSLGGGQPDLPLSQSIGAAYDQGVRCIVAAGNNGRRDVSYPAIYKRAIAVSALGRRGTFPAGSTEGLDAMEPFPTNDPDAFVARFSNIGFEIDVTGPGVGVVSCFPGKRYAVMSGTSMACPAVTGVTAAHLSASPSVMNAKKGADRARKIGELLRKAARDVGLATNLQGLGLPHP